MSEDKTEISGNQEPTEELEVSKVSDTKPMLKEILAEMREGFVQLNAKVDEVKEGFVQLNAKVDEVKEGFTQLNAKVDEGFARINSRIDAVETELAEFRLETGKNYRDIDRKFTVLNNQILKAHSDILDHENRLDNVERKAS
jgi:uncharacterized phage infection (PIP) family protein YhgE